MRVPACLARAAAAAIIACGAAACYATHEHREIREKPAVSGAASLQARVALVAGDLRLGRGERDALYDLKVRYCRSHFAPRLTHGGDGAPFLEVGLRRRRAEAVAVPAGEERNRIDLGLNPDRPVDLRLDLGAGRHAATLGGLHLVGLEVACGDGAVTLDFDEPTRGELERIAIDAGTGALRLARLGNASPAGFVVHGGSGPIELDLRGAWRRDASLQVGVRLGDVLLLVPRALAVDLGATGRDPADLLLVGFARGPEGRYLSPAADGARRLSIEIGPGIGLIEARLVDDDKMTSLAFTTRSPFDIKPALFLARRGSDPAPPSLRRR